MKYTLFILVLLIFVSVAPAAEIMPNFNTLPSGWTTDRYEPATFTNVGTFAGKNNVLGIGISEADNLALRPGGFASTFYNTQGRQYIVSGGMGSSLTADLYIPESWANEANGTRRTDMWGVANDGTSVTGYPIIGFTNWGGTPRFRTWDGTSGWVDLTTPVAYGQWTTLQILLTNTQFEYRVNGSLEHFSPLDGSTGFGAVIMQGYNFGDPALANAITGGGKGSYTAYWANTGGQSPVPEPATYGMMGLGLAAIGLISRRRMKTP